MEKKYIVALDQGTTSCRAIIFDKHGNIVGKRSKEFRQIYPKPGWVEHDPEEIWQSQLFVLKEVIHNSGISIQEIAAMGITNQRETVVVWDRHTGKPIHNAIVWQCRRTASLCDELKEKNMTDVIHQKTGLLVDAYFSATKLYWLLNQIPGARAMAEAGDIIAGTIDTWLIWNFTGGKVHATDYTNASRTMLYNINELCWDEELMDELEIPESTLPEVRNSSAYFGSLDKRWLGEEIPITGVAGDQHAALFGQICFEPGMAKNTYGTGCFLLMNTGKDKIFSKNGLLTTIAWGIGGEIEYALEGSVFSAGSAIQWLRDELGIIKSAAESEDFAKKVKDSNGVYMVPAFVGLGAPYWDMYARGAIFGLTRGANKYHIVRAALESLAYQTRDVLEVMEEDSGIGLKELKVDGGASSNDFLMQFQANILNVPVLRPENVETTAQGAAFLAGLEAGIWNRKNDIIQTWTLNRRFIPSMSKKEREKKYKGWKKAAERSCKWVDN